VLLRVEDNDTGAGAAGEQHDVFALGVPDGHVTWVAHATNGDHSLIGA
jgi:hypothetical protein